MLEASRKRFAVIGAGPKGIAVAVKAKVLAELGLPSDHVILIEKSRAAAHWSGEFGYTNGEMRLGTSPEKDVVFPLETDVGNEALNARVRSRLLHFTWTSYLAHTKEYSDWVDRGRPAPHHRQWAGYLRWVHSQLAPHATLVTAEVIQIDLDPKTQRWNLQLRTADRSETEVLEADRLMLTGPGNTRTDFLREGSDLPESTYDLQSFWGALKKDEFPETGRLAIVGAGENAASVLLALASHFPNRIVDVISPRGFVSTRAEGYYENQIYSQPERNRWNELEIADRIDFIQRTDLGVFSVDAMKVLNEQSRHRIIPGKVVALHRSSGETRLELEYRTKKFSRDYDQVVFATGFDPISHLKRILSPRARAWVEEGIASPIQPETISSRILPDLSVSGIHPPLHLPMLAGIMQGPGFSNLSCLGRLSDRVLRTGELASAKPAYLERVTLP